jgi:hypothetical protein
MGSAHHLHVVHPRGVPPRTVVPLLLGAGIEFPAEPQPVGGLATPGPSFFELQKQPREATKLSSARCGEKGCIFPASGGTGKCLHHYREEHEPSMYHSKQPTWAALQQGRFIESREETIFGSREADRRRFDTERETFLES